MKKLRTAVLAVFLLALLALAGSAVAEYTMPYYLVVDLNRQVVVAFDTATDQPVRYMICSSGKASTPTVTGTFKLPGTKAQSWCVFPGCYVRYPTRIKGGYYFHSILYSSRNPSSLNQESWHKLGVRASHGCVRLAPIDAQWINYHCKKGTKVRIVKNSGIVGLGQKHDEIMNLYKNKLGHSGVQPTLSPTPTPAPPTLNPGDTNVRVKSLKSKLKSRGYFAGSTSSALFDEEAVAAWKQYEKDAGLKADGIATPSEQAKLTEDEEHFGTNVPLKKGSTGLVVKKVEARLKALGFFSGTPNTTYDAATAKAVTAFQKAGGLALSTTLSTDQQKLLFSVSAPTPTPKPPLSLGSKGNDVKALQARLRSLGFYGGKPNGTFNAATKNAVEAYQKAAGLAVTGQADSALQLRVASDDSLTGTARTLKPGATGIVVKAFKTRLNRLGYIGASAVSTSYNASTAKAVKKFQQANGLKPTGYASPETQLKLIEMAGK